MFETGEGWGEGGETHKGEKCAHLQKLILRQGSQSVAETVVYNFWFNQTFPRQVFPSS